MQGLLCGAKKLNHVAYLRRDRIMPAQSGTGQRHRVVPSLVVSDKDPRAAIVAWLREHRPDAVICRCDDVLAAIAVLKLRIPLDLGYVSVNVGPRRVHSKGWMFADDPDVRGFVPHVILRAEGQTHYFRGRKERRPDVAEALRRDEALHSGFYFVIPKASLEAETFDISLVLKESELALYSNSDHQVTIADPGAASE